MKFQGRRQVRGRAGGGALLAAFVVTTLLSTSATASNRPATTTTTTQPVGSPITPGLVAYLRTRSDTVSIAVRDVFTTQTWTFNPTLLYHAASVAKVNLLAAFLNKLQVTKMTMTPGDRVRLSEMIINSNNVNADYFYAKVGSCDGLTVFNAQIPMPSTTPGCPYAHILGWGTTSTNVVDQLALFRLFMEPNSLLTDASRTFGVNLLTHISPAHRWGVATGPPPGTVVAFKNGWSPLDSYQNWEINSVGWVHGYHRFYQVAILSSHNPSYDYGRTTVDTVARSLWTTMGASRYFTPTTSSTTTTTVAVTLR
jgi:hypothetical protein